MKVFWHDVIVIFLVRTRTSIPVPKVLAWDSNAANPVGAEYTILEKVPGVPLSQKWDSMSETEQYSLIERIVNLEKELACLRFPAYGSLYFRQAIADESRRCTLNASLDPSQLFCVGPSCDRSWLTSKALDAKESDSEGPCQYFTFLRCVSGGLLRIKLQNQLIHFCTQGLC